MVDCSVPRVTQILIHEQLHIVFDERGQFTQVIKHLFDTKWQGSFVFNFFLSAGDFSHRILKSTKLVGFRLHGRAQLAQTWFLFLYHFVNVQCQS